MAEEERTNQVNIRLTDTELEVLDAEVERRKKAEPQATVARSEVARIMMFRGLNAPNGGSKR